MTLWMLLLLSLVVFGLVVAAMAVGVIFRGRCLRGSCGGPLVFDSDGEPLTCDSCPRREEILAEARRLAANADSPAR